MGDRGWEFAWAVAPRAGALETAISDYKYGGRRELAARFAGLLVAFLEAHAAALEPYSLIVASPAFTGPGGRPFDHVGTILDLAAGLTERWSMRSDLVTKSVPTRRLAELGGYARRSATAATQLRAALEVARPELVAGRDVLVFDDVLTSGLTLREVAFKLLDAGARSVSGLVLARQPHPSARAER